MNLPKFNSADGRCYWMKPEVQEELQPLFDQCIQDAIDGRITRLDSLWPPVVVSSEGAPFEVHALVRKWAEVQQAETLDAEKAIAFSENLRRQIMKAPLSFLRVTSRYSMARRHPVFGNVRPHQGIDYGAPSGTPIMAVGDGVITSIGRAGGYGNQIIIRHNNGLESLYGHMSRFAKTMKKGKRVRQGQTIGYVGATGTATGPHLDFRIRKNGTFVNPGKLIIPRDPGLEKRRLDRYRAVVRAADACLAGNLPTPYDPDAWFGNES